MDKREVVGASPIVFAALGEPSADEGVCGLKILGVAGDSVARLVLGRGEHTQRVLYQLAQAGQLYEPQTSMLALSVLRPGDIALDIGAHVGYFTMLFRLAVGEKGRVFAFEPLAETYQRLLHNVLINGFTNVQPLPLAVAEQVGVAYFHANPSNEGESSLFADAGPSVGPVQVTALDTLFREDLPTRPRLMKIDAEGAEMHILRGGRAWFDRQGPDMVIVEINRGALARGGATEWDIRRYFESRGYRGGVIKCSSGDMGIGDANYRYFDDEYGFVPADYRYVFNEIFVRSGSGIDGA